MDQIGPFWMFTFYSPSILVSNALHLDMKYTHLKNNAWTLSPKCKLYCSRTSINWADDNIENVCDVELSLILRVKFILAILFCWVFRYTDLLSIHALENILLFLPSQSVSSVLIKTQSKTFFWFSLQNICAALINK